MIKLFLCDVDGVLTDGIYHTSEDGKLSKNFFTRDFHGLWMLKEAGVKIGIITAGNDDVIDHQCRRILHYADLIKGSKDKLKSIEDKYEEFDWSEIAYIGDDIIDIELLSAVGLCACPVDADRAVIQLIETRGEDEIEGYDDLDIDSLREDHVSMDEEGTIFPTCGEGFLSDFPGGHGCVREFAEYVLEINKARRKK